MSQVIRQVIRTPGVSTMLQTVSDMLLEGLEVATIAPLYDSTSDSQCIGYVVVANELPKLPLEAIKRLFTYSMSDIDFKYEGLTQGENGEQALISREEFDQLVAWLLSRTQTRSDRSRRRTRRS